MKPPNSILDHLSLRVVPSRSPFALNAPEVLFGPDDWAWQFLRLNEKYRSEYAVQLAKDHIGMTKQFCREEFGLSTWLDPRETRLPDIGRHESWFFPIRAVADCPENSALPSWHAGRFGYSEIDDALIHTDEFKIAGSDGNVQRSSRSVLVHFLVNCAVAPAAQLLTIEKLCRAHRYVDDQEFLSSHSFIRRMGARAPGARRAWAVQEVAAGGVLDLPRVCPWPTKARLGDSPEPEEYWRVVSIDIHRPIQRQLDRIAPTLRRIHVAAHSERAKAGRWPDTFKLAIQSLHGVEPRPSDGHYLKALVVIKELHSLEISIESIGTLLAIEPVQCGSTKAEINADLAWDFWLDGRVRRIGHLLKQANDVVNGGYRWLVNADKPEMYFP